MLTHLLAESQDWATGNSKLCCRVEALEFKEPGAQEPAIKPLCGGFPQIRVFFFWGGAHNKDDSIWGSILGSPYLGKLP